MTTAWFLNHRCLRTDCLPQRGIRRSAAARVWAAGRMGPRRVLALPRGNTVIPRLLIAAPLRVGVASTVSRQDVLCTGLSLKLKPPLASVTAVPAARHVGTVPGFSSSSRTFRAGDPSPLTLTLPRSATEEPATIRAGSGTRRRLELVPAGDGAGPGVVTWGTPGVGDGTIGGAPGVGTVGGVPRPAGAGLAEDGTCTVSTGAGLVGVGGVGTESTSGEYSTAPAAVGL